MKLNDYQHFAMQFRLPTANAQYAMLNLSGEVGELHSLIAKAVRDGYDSDILLQQAEKEMGDILWCLAALCDSFGITLEDIAALNLAKLSLRKHRGTIMGSGDDR